MDWLFTNLGSVIDQRRNITLEHPENKHKPMDLLQILLDAEVGSGSSRGNSVSHLTMSDSDEDYNSNYDMDSHFSPEIGSGSTVTYLKSKLDEVFQQQKRIEEVGCQGYHGETCGESWQCPKGAPCESPKTRLSIDVSTLT